MSLSDRMIEHDGECNYNLDLATACLAWVENMLNDLLESEQIEIEVAAIQKHIQDTRGAIEEE